MKTNINLELFKRYAPKHKLEIIESLSQEEILAITPATIIRMVREAGESHYKSKRDKKLCVRRVIRKGNEWNSEFTGVDLLKGKLYVNLYVQYDNTDTEDCISYDEFMRDKDRFRGSIKTAEQKKEEYKEVISLLKRGYSIRNVAKLTGFSIQTVQTVKNQFVNT